MSSDSKGNKLETCVHCKGNGCTFDGYQNGDCPQKNCKHVGCEYFCKKCIGTGEI